MNDSFPFVLKRSLQMVTFVVLFMFALFLVLAPNAIPGARQAVWIALGASCAGIGLIILDVMEWLEDEN